MSLCDSDCNYVSYDFKSKKAECECNVKFRIRDLYEIKIDKEKLQKKFNLKNLINIKVMKCFKKLFSKDGLFYNIGSYIILSIIFIYVICIIYLRFKDFYSFKTNIKSYFDFIKRKKGAICDNKKILKKKNLINKNVESTKKENKKFFKTKVIESKDKSNEKIIKKDETILKTIKIKKDYEDFNDKINNQINKQKNNQIIKVSKNKDKITDKTFLFFSDYELNNYKYENALSYDKRAFCQYYYSLVKYEHLLFFAIIPSKDFNAKTIKLCILLFSFALYLSNKALFMNEETIHNIYKKKGAYDIIYQLPQMVYSCIISIIINNIIRYFSLTGKEVIKYKNKITNVTLVRISKKLINSFVIKFIFFFIISFIFLFFFWVYVSCFCFIYRNTQIYLIKDTLISFGLSLIYPFICYLLSAAFRINSLRDVNKSRNYMYKLGSLLVI